MQTSYIEYVVCRLGSDRIGSGPVNIQYAVAFCSSDVKAPDKHEVKTERQFIVKAKSPLFGL